MRSKRYIIRKIKKEFKGCNHITIKYYYDNLTDYHIIYYDEKTLFLPKDKDFRKKYYLYTQSTIKGGLSKVW